jgi:ABC-type branched-subunit amino acid transport system ATPase component
MKADLTERPLLEVGNIHAGYGKAKVLHGITLKVIRTEIVSVIGPNGAGKSTLLRNLIGLLKPSQGKILFDGEEITGFPPNVIMRRGIGYVPPQGSIVFPGLTVFENLMMGGFTIQTKKKLGNMMNQVFDLFPILRDRQKQLAGTLSGGQQQMVNIGRAMMATPTLLLLDEPSMGLSPKFVDMIFLKLRELNRMEMTLVLVEQQAKRALEISDRSYIIDLGQIRYESQAAELLSDDKIIKMYLAW